MEVEQTIYKYWRVSAVSGNFRPYTKSKPEFDASENGGITICTVVLQNGVVGTDISYCVMGDVFEYKEGRDRAFIRAFEDAVATTKARMNRK